MSRKPQKEFKIILTGAANTGKSSLIERYINKRFIGISDPTYGVATHSEAEVKEEWEKRKRVPRTHAWADHILADFRYYDLGGQVTFAGDRPYYMIGATAVMLCFDVSNRSTMFAEDGSSALAPFLEELAKAVGKKEAKDIPFLIVGCKTDLKHEVIEKETKELADHLEKEEGYNIIHFGEKKLEIFGRWSEFSDQYRVTDDSVVKNYLFTSAKDNIAVEDAFEIIKNATLGYDQYQTRERMEQKD